MSSKKSSKEHFCVNSNVCDICNGAFIARGKVEKKGAENNSQKRRSKKGVYFVQHITWQT